MVAFDVLIEEEAREVFAEDLVCLISVDAFAAHVPGHNVAVAIKHVDGEIVYGLKNRPQHLVVTAQFFHRFALFGGVPNEADDDRARTCADGPQHDVNGKLATVFAEAVKIERGAHLPCAWMSIEVLTMAWMMFTESLRD